MEHGLRRGLTSRSITTTASVTVDVLGPDLSGVCGLEILDIIYTSETRQPSHDQPIDVKYLPL